MIDKLLLVTPTGLNSILAALSDPYFFRMRTDPVKVTLEYDESGDELPLRPTGNYWVTLTHYQRKRLSRGVAKDLEVKEYKSRFGVLR